MTEIERAQVYSLKGESEVIQALDYILLFLVGLKLPQIKCFWAEDTS